MKAFLLAAGKGTRISKNIPEVPKCTLPIDGVPLIVRTVEMLLDNDIEVVIIVGYKHKIIEQMLIDYPVKIVFNPFFDVTNSIGSLYLAKEFLVNEDTIIGNADVFWQNDILDILLSCKNDATLLSDVTRVSTGDYFFKTENNIVKAYGKDLKIEERSCEYVGLALIRKTFISKFQERLNFLVSEQHHDLWWENVLYSFSDEEEIYSKDVDGKFWAEIDYIDDYQRICDYIESKK